MKFLEFVRDTVFCDNGQHLRRDYVGACCFFEVEQEGCLMDIVEATHEFMVLGEQIGYDDSGRVVPGWDGRIDSDIRQLRLMLLSEEVTETLLAEAESDVVEVADGLADIIVVAVGSLLAYFGVDVARQILTEVAVSNLDKVEDGPIFNEAGKLMKPDGWEPPRIREILERAGFVE